MNVNEIRDLLLAISWVTNSIGGYLVWRELVLTIPTAKWNWDNRLFGLAFMVTGPAFLFSALLALRRERKGAAKREEKSSGASGNDERGRINDERKRLRSCC